MNIETLDKAYFEWREKYGDGRNPQDLRFGQAFIGTYSLSDLPEVFYTESAERAYRILSERLTRNKTTRPLFQSLQKELDIIEAAHARANEIRQKMFNSIEVNQALIHKKTGKIYHVYSKQDKEGRMMGSKPLVTLCGAAENRGFVYFSPQEIFELFEFSH